MRRALFLLLCLLPVAALADDKPSTFDLWPGDPPGPKAEAGEEKDTTTDKSGLVAGKRVVRLTNVSKPTLTVYPAPKDKANGTAVIVCPGGGYNVLALDLEGTEVCEWLNSLGVTAVLLKYRVPARDKEKLAPVTDAQRAVGVVRAKAKEWGVDPKRVGILGFSAGGNLAARTALCQGKRAYDAVDDADKQDCTPDFAVLVYTAYLVTDKKKDKPDEEVKLREEIQVTEKSPPMFLVHTKDDPVPVQNSELLHAALKKAGVATELKVYDKGGHGYGLRKTDSPCTTWPEPCEAWLKERGYLKR